MTRALALLGIALLVAGCAASNAGDADSDLTGLRDGQSGSAEQTESSTAYPDVEEIPELGPAPNLEGIEGWLQTDIVSLDDLRGKVVVVQFWTFGCHNCKNTLPNMKALYAEHAGEDFEIVGVHSPEFSYEEDPDAIAAAADELGVAWPIALDTRQRSFFGWQGSPAYWPRTYVLDRDGIIRFDHIGEGAYDELNQTVAALLG